MKIFAVFLGLIIVISAYLVFFSGGSKITNYPPSGKAIVAFGDSLVVGVGATEGNDFVSKLSVKINTPIINLGKSGDTTADGLARLDQVLAEDPKIVLLLLGGNDYLKKIPREETFSNLEIIIKTIHDSGAVVVLLGVRGGLLRDNFEEDFARLAEKHGTAYVTDVLDGVFAHHDLMSDPTHPNDAGYEIIASRIEPILEELLE